MNRLLKTLGFMMIAIAGVGSPGLPTATAAPAENGSRAVPLVGTLQDDEAWRFYKTSFVTETGRVVDTANGQISHSESQGYGMLLAVAAGDRASFDRIWGWTRANLAVRNDALLAWRWEPDRRPAVADLNNASDGDILIAWALTEAAEAWSDEAYQVAARRISVEIGRKLVLWNAPGGPLLLPAAAGFAAEDRADGPIINLSYYIFPAFMRLGAVAPEFDWLALSRNGLRLIEASRFGRDKLPVEWISLGADKVRSADGFAAEFAYNAIRIPLYLAWSGTDRSGIYDPFVSVWTRQGAPNLATVDVSTAMPRDRLGEAGYLAVPALTACAASGARWPRQLNSSVPGENYYPNTLRLLSRIAVRMRYPSCLRD